MTAQFPPGLCFGLKTLIDCGDCGAFRSSFASSSFRLADPLEQVGDVHEMSAETLRLKSLKSDLFQVFSSELFQMLSSLLY